MALVELSVMEQRYRAVLEVLAGCPVTEVADRFGVSRQSVHAWLKRYDTAGLAGLADRSRRPELSPNQTAGEVEALVCELRRQHGRWGQRRLSWELGRRGVDPVPSLSTLYRILVRNGLVVVGARKRPRSSYTRWERDAPMQLWQMDIVGGIALEDGDEAKVVTGIDDHSRFVVIASVIARASARAVCAALAAALARYGVPEEVLTDNGKQFTGKFSKPRPVEVLFDRICRDNGITHRLTKVRSPTTTGKIERFHQTLRTELLAGHAPFADIAQAQAAVTAFVDAYNTTRPHQSLDMAPPAARFTTTAAAAHAHAGAGLRLPPGLTSIRTGQIEPTSPDADASDWALVPVRPQAAALAVEFERTVPASGNLGVLKRQVWMGRSRAGHTVTVWTDATTMNVFTASGELIRTHPVRLAEADMVGLRARGARPGRACAVSAAEQDQAVQVRRWVSQGGTVRLAGTPISVGMDLAGERVTLRLEGSVLHVICGEILRRSLPNPVPASKRARLHGARKADPAPTQRAGAVTVHRVVSSQGAFMITGETIQVGQSHRGKLVAVTVDDACYRVSHHGHDLGTFPRTSTKQVTRHRASGHITYKT